MTMYLGNKPVKVAYDLPYKHTSVEEAFTSRQTANGLTLVEPSPAIVEMIKGKTVKSDNLLNAQEGKTSDTKYVFDVGSITNNSMSSSASDTVKYTRVYKAGTYTIRCNVETNSKVHSDDCRFLISAPVKGATYNQWYEMYFVYFTSGSSYTFTAQEDFTIGFAFAGDAGAKKAFTNIMLNNGTTAKPYVPYFSGLKHANFKAIKSTGKNLLNIFGRTKGAYKDFSNATVRNYLTDKEYYIGVSRTNYENPYGISVEFTADGFTVRNGGSGYGVAFPVKCKANTAYTLSFNAISDKDAFESGIGFYNADGQWLSDKYISKNATISEFTTPENCTLMTLCFYNHSPSTISAFTHIMLNEGSTALPYEPYISDEFALSAPVELPEWDYIDPQTGEIVRGTNTITLTGNENFIGGSTGTTGWGGTDTVGFYAYFKKDAPVSPADRIQQPNAIGESANWYCNKFVCKYTVYDTGSDGFMANGSYLGFRVKRSLLAEYGSDNSSTAANITAFKAWLADMYAKGDPVIISYEVMDEFKTIETLDCPKEYMAYNGGSETIEQGDTDNSQWGAIPVPTITYLEKLEGNYFLKVPIKKFVGKNLLNIFGRTRGEDGAWSNTTVRVFDETKYCVGLVVNNYWAANRVEVDFAGHLFVKSIALGYGIGFPVKCKPNTSYSISWESGTKKGRVGVGYYTGDGVWLSNIGSKQSAYTFTTPENCGWMTIVFSSDVVNETYEFYNIMLNEGDTALPYEPYTEWYEY